jgi:hypothetical protein
MNAARSAFIQEGVNGRRKLARAAARLGIWVSPKI